MRRPAAAPTTPAAGRLGVVALEGPGGLDETAPVFQRVRRVAVDLQPGERFAERPAMEQRPLRACRQSHVDEPPLQSDDLPQPLDIAAREREQAQ